MLVHELPYLSVYLKACDNMNKNAQFLSKCIFVRYDGVNPVVVQPGDDPAVRDVM